MLPEDADSNWISDCTQGFYVYVLPSHAHLDRKEHDSTSGLARLVAFAPIRMPIHVAAKHCWSQNLHTMPNKILDFVYSGV